MAAVNKIVDKVTDAIPKKKKIPGSDVPQGSVGAKKLDPKDLPRLDEKGRAAWGRQANNGSFTDDELRDTSSRRL